MSKVTELFKDLFTYLPPPNTILNNKIKARLSTIYKANKSRENKYIQKQLRFSLLLFSRYYFLFIYFKEKTIFFPISQLIV